MSSVNPFTLEVIRNAIISIAEEMRVSLMRSARSALLQEAGDLSCVLTDAQGRLIAQGRDHPIHLGVMAHTVKEFLKRLSAETLRPGDMYLTNAMDMGGNHLPDVKAITPIFYQGRLVAFAVNIAHWPDIGGTVPGSYVPNATELIQEGLHIPPIRLFTQRGVDQELLDFILYNVRVPEERKGDIFGQYACNEVAARRLVDVFERHGADTVLASMERFLDESENLMRKAIADAPDGVYSGEDHLDNDGVGDTPVKIAVDVTIQGDRMIFDFSRSDPQVRGPVNATYFIACAAAYYSAKALFGPTIPTNDGCYRPLEVITPRGSLLNPEPWAPRVDGNNSTAMRTVDTIFRALSTAAPDRIVAGGGTTAAVLALAGRDKDTGEGYVYFEVHGGGEGGQACRDGAAGLKVHLGNTMNTPIEAVEAEYPLRIEHYGLLPGTGGRGYHRGAVSLRRSYRILAKEMQAATMVDRCEIPPWGVFGGEPGIGYRLSLNPGTPDERRLRGRESFTVRQGDLIQIDTVGGGGYGPPEERPEELEERDRLLGYV